MVEREGSPHVGHALSGADVKRMIRGAAGWVALHREALNLINVFPVPDGDTGANLGPHPGRRQ